MRELYEKARRLGKFKIKTRKVGKENWRTQISQKNLILNTGVGLIHDKMVGNDTTNYIKSFALGTGTTTPAVTDTGLETPIPYSGSNIYKAFEEQTDENDYTTLFVGFLSSTQPVTQPVDITEIGLFTGLLTTAGIGYCRATFDAINKTTSLEMRIEYTQEWN